MEKLFNQIQFIQIQAWRDFIRNFHKRWVIIVTIFISTFVLFLISTLNFSINQELKANTKIILGGDAEIEVNTKPLDSEIIKKLELLGDISLNTSLTSMASSDISNDILTAFIRLRVIDDKYPLYGSIKTKDPDNLEEFYKNNNQVLIKVSLEFV